MLFLDAFLIVGGNWAETSVEMWTPDGRQCYLPPLPENRYWGSQEGFLYCGGGNEISRSCVEFKDGSWVTYPNVFNQPRWYHSSWKTDDGIFWIGGEDSAR